MLCHSIFPTFGRVLRNRAKANKDIWHGSYLYFNNFGRECFHKSAVHPEMRAAVIGCERSPTAVSDVCRMRGACSTKLEVFSLHRPSFSYPE